MSTGKAVTLVFGGALVGAGVTTLVLKKKYEARAEKDIASVRESYIERMRILEDELRGSKNHVPKAPNLVVNKPTEVPMERVVPSTDTLRKAYNKIAPSAEAVQELQETVEGLGYSRKEDEVKEEEARVVIQSEEADENTPFVIPVQAYMDNEELFEQFTLTYYVGDKTLVVEDSDNVVEDIDQTVGFHNLHNFGVESGNDDTVYVRNPKKETEYEILRDEGKYSENVQGIDTWSNSPEPKNPIRKFV